MSTKSRCQYGLSRLAHNQSDDLLIEFVNDLGIVTKPMDVMWHYLFGKPRSFGEHPYFDERVNVISKEHADGEDVREDSNKGLLGLEPPIPP